MALLGRGCGGRGRPAVVPPDGLFFREGAAPDAGRFGRMLGGQAIAAVEGSVPLAATPLAAVSGKVTLPLDPPPDAATLRETLADEQIAPRTRAWAGRMYELLEQDEPLAEAEETEVQVF